MPKFIDSIAVKDGSDIERTIADTSGNLYHGGTQITATAAELNLIDGADTTSGAKFVQVQEAAISYTDSAAALITIPDGAKILSIAVEVTTGFNGTTPTYDIGYDGNADAIVDGGTLSATAGRSTLSPPAATVGEWNGVTSGVLIGTFAGGGSNTAGAGVLKVAYYTD